MRAAIEDHAGQRQRIAEREIDDHQVVARPAVEVPRGRIGKRQQEAGRGGRVVHEHVGLGAVRGVADDAKGVVAGVIEGYADRMKNIRLRLSDYRGKLAQLFTTYARLEVLFPEDDVLEMLKSPKTLIKSIDNQDLERIMIVNALDLLYFWMYQPQACNALSIIIHEMSPEERCIMLRSQYILKREKDISQMLVDGVVGKNFAMALSFYLERHPAYLHQIKKKWDT